MLVLIAFQIIVFIFVGNDAFVMVLRKSVLVFQCFSFNRTYKLLTAHLCVEGLNSISH